MNICAFIGDMYRDYSSTIIKTLMTITKERGHRLDIFGNCAVPSENPLHAEGLRSILAVPVLTDYDGIILCSDTLNHAGLSKVLMDRLKNTEELPPVVSIRSDEEGFCNIIPDNKKIMYDVTRHMIEACGCGDIGFLMGRDDLKDSYERLEGFKEAMAEAGFEVTDDLIFHGNYWINQGPETADFFIKEHGALPRGIVASNDYMAVGLLDELIIRGYKIPEDVMIAGVDNQPLTATRVPTLTTFEIPEDYLATTAVDTLEKLVAGKDVPPHIGVPGNLIVRESTGGNWELDLNETYSRLDKLQREYYDKTFAFVLLSSEYEDALSFDSSIKLTLNDLMADDLFSEGYLCRYCENDRSLMGYFKDGNITVSDIRFPNDKLLPCDFYCQETGTYIYMSVHYKNEVYGYCVLKMSDDITTFFDERLEFILMLFGQSLNRLRLYDKLFEVADVIDLYVRDELTGLFNRRGFENKISALLENRDPRVPKIAVASIDMDGLKYINDTFGHAAGDTAIKAVASSISSALTGKEFVSRMGGDEFEAVLVLDNPGRIGQFIRAIRKALEDENERLNAPYKASVSIGICEVADWNSLMDSINEADKAMYTEKRIKKNRSI